MKLLITNLEIKGDGKSRRSIIIGEDNKDGMIFVSCILKDVTIKIYDYAWFNRIFQNCIFVRCETIAFKNSNLIASDINVPSKARE